MSLLDGHVAAANAGVELFAAELEAQDVSVQRIDWRPPAAGTEDALARLARVASSTTDANDRALRRLNAAHPHLTGVGVAHELIDGMERNTLLHAGPPISWPDMSGPLRGAVIGATLLEGLADEAEEAARLAAAGGLEFVPCHERGAVGPMAGVVSASMPMWIVTDTAHGNRAFATFNEGLGKVLRYGAFDAEVIERLRWMGRVLRPVMAAAIEARGETVDLRALVAGALQMGDEAHNRNRAGTSLLLRELMPALLSLELDRSDVVAGARFVANNDHFFLNLAMAAGKATADAAAGIAGSSLVVAMARNGTDFGIRLSGTGDRWFTAPAGRVDGLYLPGFSEEDGNPDIGDSTITETIGLGGFAMAAAPAIVSFVGGSAEDALATTRSMYEITWGTSDHYKVPSLGFAGTPLGIDCRAVVQTGLLPTINTGIAHREAGIGQVGAGLAKPPMEAFAAAVAALAEGRSDPSRGEGST
jgi:hypothetical protein